MELKIIPNPRKPWARKLANDVRAFLGKEHRFMRKGADATICIGGDGTILYANHKKSLEGAVLGMGSEKSYVCQLERYSWKKKIRKLLESKKKVKIMTLDAQIGNKKFNALNDFVIHATSYRVVEMDVRAGARHSSFEGDGMIVSTPLGSAAYAYSAGGKKLKPTARKIELVPICAYKRAFRPAILAAGANVSIKAGDNCAFITDGVFVRNLNKGEIVRIKRGRDIVFFEGVGR